METAFEFGFFVVDVTAFVAVAVLCLPLMGVAIAAPVVLAAQLGAMLPWARVGPKAGAKAARRAAAVSRLCAWGWEGQCELLALSLQIAGVYALFAMKVVQRITFYLGLGLTTLAERLQGLHMKGEDKASSHGLALHQVFAAWREDLLEADTAARRAAAAEDETRINAQLKSWVEL